MADDSSPPPAVLKNKTAIACHWLFGILLALAFALEIISLMRPGVFTGQLDALCIVLAAASTLAAMWRRLPLQNVLPAALGIAVIGGGFSAFGASSLGAKTGLPFGPFIYGSALGPKIFNLLPWAMPLVWVVIILNSRGVARMILRPWRKTKSYGYKVIGLTGLLVVAFDVALEPFAFRIRHYWNWMPTSFPLTWQCATPINFMAWWLIAVLILLFISPLLIVKRPRSKSGAQFHPLCVWLGAVIFFGIACALNAVWPPVFVDVTMGIIVTVFSVSGARW
jgi:putative membrane protein